MDVRPGTSRFVLTAGVFSGVTATFISASLIELFWGTPKGSLHSVGEVAYLWLALCLFTVIPAGTFGFLCGIVGAISLSARTKYFRTRTQLLVEAASAGCLLGLIFPLFHWVMGWGPDRSWVEPGGFAFSAAVGCTCALLFALVFGKGLLAKRAA